LVDAARWTTSLRRCGYRITSAAAWCPRWQIGSLGTQTAPAMFYGPDDGDSLARVVRVIAFAAPHPTTPSVPTDDRCFA